MALATPTFVGRGVCWLVVCGALLASGGSVARAQMVRLPAVIPPESLLANPQLPSGTVPMYSTGPERAIPASYPSELDQQLVPAPQASAVPPPPTGAKPGFFQQIAFTSTFLPRGNSNLGITSLALQSTFALPCPTPDSPLVLTPAFEAQLLDGPPSPSDLPPEIYDASFQFRFLRKLSPEWGMDIAVTPGWHGDFQQNDSKAFRLPGRAIAAYDWSPQTQLVLGIAFLDREDVNWLPVGGLIITPDPDTRWELIVPRPRFAQRFVADCHYEDWWYLAGEFGGGSYAIQRASGAQDVATLSDYRFIFGLERKRFGGINQRLEIGYVFGRKVDYLSATPDFSPGSTVLVRAGASY